MLSTYLISASVILPHCCSEQPGFLHRTKHMRTICSWTLILIGHLDKIWFSDSVFRIQKYSDQSSLDQLQSFVSQSVQLLSHVRLFATPWTAARQASLSITSSQSLPKPMSMESVMPSNHLILCRPLLLLPSIFPSIRVFSNESALCIRWPKYWISASASFLPKKSQDWSPLGWTGWISLQSKGLSRVFSNTTVQKHQFFSAQVSL